MITYNGGFPNLAIFIQEGEMFPFKCRIAEEDAQFFSYNAGGLVDVGKSLTIITPRRFELKSGSRVVLDGIRYSVQAIIPFIPDKVNVGPFNRKINAEYLIRLG